MRFVAVLFVLMGCGLLVLATVAPAAVPRTVSATYVGGAHFPVCAYVAIAGAGGACFPVQSGEALASVVVDDDVSPAVGAWAYVFHGYQVASQTYFCGDAVVALASGATRVAIAPMDPTYSALVCAADGLRVGGPATTGTITITFS